MTRILTSIGREIKVLAHDHNKWPINLVVAESGDVAARTYSLTLEGAAVLANELLNMLQHRKSATSSGRRFAWGEAMPKGGILECELNGHPMYVAVENIEAGEIGTWGGKLVRCDGGAQPSTGDQSWARCAQCFSLLRSVPALPAVDSAAWTGETRKAPEADVTATAVERDIAVDFVRKFQKAAKLTVDGVAGPETHLALARFFDDGVGLLRRERDAARMQRDSYKRELDAKTRDYGKLEREFGETDRRHRAMIAELEGVVSSLTRQLESDVGSASAAMKERDEAIGSMHSMRRSLDEARVILDAVVAIEIPVGNAAISQLPQGAWTYGGHVSVGQPSRQAVRYVRARV